RCFGSLPCPAIDLCRTRSSWLSPDLRSDLSRHERRPAKGDWPPGKGKGPNRSQERNAYHTGYQAYHIDTRQEGSEWPGGGLIDVVMIANLLIMVIVGGYETFVSRLNKGHPDQPEWLSHVNAG